MKKLLALLLALVMVCALTACGGSDSGSSKSAKKEQTEEKLEPVTDLPDYCEDFQVAVDEAKLDTEVIEEFMGYAIAAYNTMDSEEFCTFIYESDYFDEMMAQQQKLSEAAAAVEQVDADSSTLKIALTSLSVQYASANAAFASFNVAYAEENMGLEDKNFDDEMETMGFVLNVYGKLFYGQEVVTA